MTRKRKRNVIKKENVAILIAWMVQNKAVFISKRKKIDWIAKQATDTLGFLVTTNNIRHAIYRHPELAVYGGKSEERKRRLEKEQTPLFTKIEANPAKTPTEAPNDLLGRMQLLLPEPLSVIATTEQRDAYVSTLHEAIKAASAFRDLARNRMHVAVDLL